MMRVAMVMAVMMGAVVMLAVIVRAHKPSISARAGLSKQNVIVLQNAAASARQRLDADSLAQKHHQPVKADQREQTHQTAFDHDAEVPPTGNGPGRSQCNTEDFGADQNGQADHCGQIANIDAVFAAHGCLSVDHLVSDHD